MKKPPKELDQIADKVLSYRVPARTKKAKKRQRKRRKIRERVVIVGSINPVECVIREYED